MKKILGLIIVGLFGFLVAGCGFNPFNVVNGSGKIVTETRSVSNFNAVLLSGIGDLTITQGDTEALTVQTDDNIMPLIKTQVENGTLTLGFRDNPSPVVRPTLRIKFNLTLKNLTDLQVSGAGNVTAANLKTEHLTISLTGAGNVSVAHLEGAEGSTRISGAGNVELAGQVMKQDASLSGLGNYRAGDLKSDTAQVHVTGAGKATVWAANTLDVSISGAGSVEYYGSPQLTQNISGAGSVKGLGAK